MKAKFWRYFVGPYDRVCLSWLAAQRRIREYFLLVYFEKKEKDEEYTFLIFFACYAILTGCYLYSAQFFAVAQAERFVPS